MNPHVYSHGFLCALVGIPLDWNPWASEADRVVWAEGHADYCASLVPRPKATLRSEIEGAAPEREGW